MRRNPAQFAMVTSVSVAAVALMLVAAAGHPALLIWVIVILIRMLAWLQGQY